MMEVWLATTAFVLMIFSFLSFFGIFFFFPQVNDTVKINLETGKVEDFLKFDIGQLVMITRGRNAGRVGLIQSIEK